MLYCFFCFGIDNVQVKRGEPGTLAIGAIVTESNNCHMIPASGSGGVKGHAPCKAQSSRDRSGIIRIPNIRDGSLNRVVVFLQVIVKSRNFRYSVIGYVFKDFRLFKNGKSFVLLGAVGRQGVVVEGIRRFSGFSLLHHGTENRFTADLGIVAIA